MDAAISGIRDSSDPVSPNPAISESGTGVSTKRPIILATPEDPNFYATDAFTDNALEWFDEPETQEKPFILYLSYNAPHYSPFTLGPEDIAKYEGVYDDGYQAIQESRHQRQVEMGLIDPKEPTSRQATGPRLEYAER